MYAKAHELGYDTTMSTPADTQLRVKNQWNITVQPVIRVEDAEGAEAKSIEVFNLSIIGGTRVFLMLLVILDFL